jgi:hypothetical protein
LDLKEKGKLRKIFNLMKAVDPGFANVERARDIPVIGIWKSIKSENEMPAARYF